MSLPFDPIVLVISIIPLIFAITLHEAAHGLAAKFFGDSTAYYLGRITANPTKHIDPIGTLLLPGICLLTGAPVFGWAKPVPVNTSRLKGYYAMAMVAFAGPLSNFIQACLWKILSFIGPLFELNQLFYTMCKTGVMINITLMIFNLLPIPPLDGAKIIEPALSRKIKYQFHKLEQHGFIILIILSFTGILGIILRLMMPLFSFLY